MKLILFIGIFCFFVINNIVAQEPLLLVQGTAANNFVLHKVEPKENWFSIGRLYNVHPKDLALYNKSTVEKGLQIAQIINIPLTIQNKVDVFGTLEEGEATVPLYYIVKKEEGLYRVSVNNNTTMQTIREWNNLTNDTVTIGTKLKVGMLKVKYIESAFVNKNISAIPVYASVTTPIDSSVTTPNIVKPDGPTVINIKPTNEIINTKPTNEIVKTDPIAIKKPKQIGIEEPIVVANAKPKQTAIDDSIKVVHTTPVAIELNTEGYFKNKFISGNLVKEGKCNIFKSLNGWDDEKYYALVNDVPTGTVIKIENKNTGKIIYAKVLDGLKDFKQKDEITCSLSTAAAYALGVKSGVFDIVTSY